MSRETNLQHELSLSLRQLSLMMSATIGLLLLLSGYLIFAQNGAANDSITAIREMFEEEVLNEEAAYAPRVHNLVAAQDIGELEKLFAVQVRNPAFSRVVALDGSGKLIAFHSGEMIRPSADADAIRKSQQSDDSHVLKPHEREAVLAAAKKNPDSPRTVTHELNGTLRSIRLLGPAELPDGFLLVTLDVSRINAIQSSLAFENRNRALLFAVILISIAAISIVYFRVKGFRILNQRVLLPINTMASNIKEVISGMNASMEQLGSSERELEEVSQQQDVHCSTIEEHTAEVRKLATQVAESAEKTASASENAIQLANNGQVASGQVTTETNRIAALIENLLAAVAASNTKVSEIMKVMETIQNETKVIDDIAFQTNLLSLNASVEAAHAGKHGKGFAVVAEEVRHLAQRSTDEAKKVEGSVVEGFKKVKSITAEIDRSATEQRRVIEPQIASCLKVVADCDAALQEIGSVTQGNAALARQVLQLTELQLTSFERITQELKQIQHNARRNHSAVNETVRVAGRLSDDSQTLDRVIQQLGSMMVNEGPKPSG